MTIRWSRLAVADRQQIFDYLVRRSPQAAASVDERIEAQIRLLDEYPLAGRPGRVEGTRELVVRGTPFLAVYMAESGGVQLLRILHGARKWPPPAASAR